MAVTKSSLEHSLAHFNARFLRRTYERRIARVHGRNSLALSLGKSAVCPETEKRKKKEIEIVNLTEIILTRKKGCD